jgi:hypothetical protein
MLYRLDQPFSLFLSFTVRQVGGITERKDSGLGGILVFWLLGYFACHWLTVHDVYEQRHSSLTFNPSAKVSPSGFVSYLAACLTLAILTQLHRFLSTPCLEHFSLQLASLARVLAQGQM